jgi:hypothetical protein
MYSEFGGEKLSVNFYRFNIVSDCLNMAKFSFRCIFDKYVAKMLTSLD